MAGWQLIVTVRRPTVSERFVIVHRWCRAVAGWWPMVIVVAVIKVPIVIVMVPMTGTVVPEIVAKWLTDGRLMRVLIMVIVVIVVVMLVVVRVIVIAVMRTGRIHTVRRIADHTEMVATASACGMAVTGTGAGAKIIRCETAETLSSWNWFVDRLEFDQVWWLHWIRCDCRISNVIYHQQNIIFISHTDHLGLGQHKNRLQHQHCADNLDVCHDEL